MLQDILIVAVMGKETIYFFIFAAWVFPVCLAAATFQIQIHSKCDIMKSVTTEQAWRELVLLAGAGWQSQSDLKACGGKSH